MGAGSYFFARPVIWNMTQSPVLREGTLALVDVNPEVLDTFVNLAKRAIETTGAPLKLVASTDRREVLEDADFVVNTFSDRNAYFRGLDCEIALKHGVRMCSGDTIGPGGMFRACREVPKALAIAEDVEKLAPEAWNLFIEQQEFDTSYSVPGLCRFRVNIFRQRGTISIVMRIIPFIVPTIEELKELQVLKIDLRESFLDPKALKAVC